MTKFLQAIEVLINTKKLIIDQKHLGVIFVSKYSQTGQIIQGIIEFTQEKNHLRVKLVIKSLLEKII